MRNDTQPEIRFPGFTEAWEQRKFNNCFNFPVSTNSLSRAMLNYDNGEIKNIHYGDILIKYSTILNVKEDEIPYITGGELEKYKSNLLENQDLIFADAAEDESVGKAVEVSGITNENLVSGLHTIVARVKGEKAPFFWGYYINSDIYHRQLLRLMQGSKVSAISKGNLQKTNVSFPNRMKEQQKIGTFFKQLDDTITLHQRKLDLLKETKKGFLQKMFPKNGAKVPEIRFPGFTEDWEDRKLGEVVVFLNGRAFKQQELLGSGKYRVLRVGNFNTNDRWYYSNLELEEDKYANKGDLLYLWATSFGPEMWNEERVIYHYHIWKLKFLSKELDKQYLYTWLLTDKEKIKESTNGTTMVHVTKGGIEQRTFQFPPDINEQKKIGNFFKQLDDTITLHQRKLDLLKEMKKGFLQKMFV